MGNNAKFGFVILHYLAFDMTKECVCSILNNYSQYNIYITIVDNASNNGSGLKLKEVYKNIKNVDVILNSTNQGFAKGNNIGYTHIIEKYAVDYVIVMNNDVIIDQQNFLDVVDEMYLNYRFAVLGPDIYCPYTEKHQNPAHLTAFTKEYVQRLYNNYSKLCKHPVVYYYRSKFLSPIKKTFIKKLGKEVKKQEIDRTQLLRNPVLHGACYIFSKDFISKRKYCFYPKTFLYMEEDILHYQCLKEKLEMIYSPNLRVQHLEDVSTNLSLKSEYKRFTFKNREMKKSICVFKTLLEKDI